MPFVRHILYWLAHQDPRILYSVLAVVVLVPIGIWLYIRSHRPTAEEIERRRRQRLALIGRITDGYLIDARALDGSLYEDPYSSSNTPAMLIYSYRLAGVTYDCAQDVSTLADRVRGYRLDQPVQVRYDVRNPGNSILVSEDWSGLRLTR